MYRSSSAEDIGIWSFASNTASSSYWRRRRHIIAISVMGSRPSKGKVNVERIHNESGQSVTVMWTRNCRSSQGRSKVISEGVRTMPRPCWRRVTAPTTGDSMRSGSTIGPFASNSSDIRNIQHRIYVERIHMLGLGSS
jgi:hypothetical protein